ncbi:uncharacterized protein EDB91DRAFT_1339607 [Suillus paluster]|uniref:uncharacterized protein n=1 Tax=Suillus paluster TaxID=48578 RepID=UPI001B86DB3D|nr:uncharacterized protein EDB91DRAFT_1339607 [Suillus paluster]KAG1726723.1 hypothetical protein EDB91DRAFT_1339607 [Suillus paluster]
MVGITTEALELYRVMHLRSPHLSIQMFVKSVCDLHEVEFRRHLSRQFSIAFDAYLQVRCNMAAMVAESLRHDSPDWRLQHACPACRYEPLDNSSLGPLARSLQHTCLVGAFHGHAHRRLCQLFSLTTYIKGLGLEDLETCECTFSKSNSLASALCYASIFHRQQAIDSYFEHNNDFEVYANISNFLYHNYKQALDVLNDGDVTLPILMEDLKLTDKSIFERWLEEEKVYLEGLTQEPGDETLHMEYWQKLVNLTMCKEALDVAMTAFQMNYEVASYDAQLVQVLECKLEIVKRWVPEDVEWQMAGRLVANRKYQRALDCLEGYRSALNTYNSIASSMYPPRQTLKWEDVVEYVFLADFDLLRDTRMDVSQHPWSSAAARRAMDLYFKMCRAREEIERLDIEVRRLVTYIRDEERYLRECEDQLKDTSTALTHQIAIHRNTRGRFNSRHLKRLYNISKLPGFSGTLTPGVSADTSPGESASLANAQIPTRMLVDPLPVDPTASALDIDTHDDLDDEEEEDEVVEQASRSLQDVLLVADDFSRLRIHDAEEYALFVKTRRESDRIEVRYSSSSCDTTSSKVPIAMPRWARSIKSLAIQEILEEALSSYIRLTLQVRNTCIIAYNYGAYVGVTVHDTQRFNITPSLTMIRVSYDNSTTNSRNGRLFRGATARHEPLGGATLRTTMSLQYSFW